MRVEEKSILAKFVSLYYISTFILLSIIALLIYNMQYQSLYNLTVSNLETISSKISSKIITTDMSGHTLDFQSLSTQNDGIKFTLYNHQNRVIFTDKEKVIEVDLEKKNYLQDGHIVIVDKSTLGHLGVYSIVMTNDTFGEKTDTILTKIFAGFIGFYIVLCAIGYYLIQLFMKPIENERKRLDNFIKDTTHELNTPITALMICSSKEAPRNEKNMERIYLSAKRISEIYKDLTHLFLNDKNQKITNLKKLQIDDIINEELEYFELLASKKNIKTIKELHPTTLQIQEDDFKRIFSNLFSNAIKYNNRNGEIYVSCENKILTIKDSGIGINKDDLNNIFNRYFRATTLDGGFGMGLNIVKQICTKYNIKIEVTSKPKEGTTFTLDFSNL